MPSSRSAASAVSVMPGGPPTKYDQRPLLLELLLLLLALLLELLLVVLLLLLSGSHSPSFRQEDHNIRGASSCVKHRERRERVRLAVQPLTRRHDLLGTLDHRHSGRRVQGGRRIATRCWTVVAGVVLACLALAVAAPANPPGLVGRYYLDELSGTSTPDSSGNGLNAVRVGAPAAIPDGRLGGAFRFGGSTDGFAGDFAPLRPATVTVAAWVRAGGTPGAYRYIVSQGAAGCSHASYALYTGDVPGLRFFVWNGSAVVQSPPAPGSVWDGAWHLVTGTYDGVAARLYVDARQVGAGTTATGPIVYGLANDSFAIGNYAGSLRIPQQCPGDFNFGGDIDEVQVFDRALSAVEIASLMANPSAGGDPPPPAPPPVSGPAPARIQARLRMTWVVGPRAVTITSASLLNVPTGAKVRLVCRSCRIRQTITAKRRARTLARLRNERLRRGQRLTVTITKSGFAGRVITRKVRRYRRTRTGIERAARRPFTERVRCIPAGATKPAKKC
jgi:hypothetical protein